MYLSSAEVSGNADTTNVIFSCKSGYKLTGPMRVSCLENSTWSDDTPECIPGEQILYHALLPPSREYLHYTSRYLAIRM